MAKRSRNRNTTTRTTNTNTTTVSTDEAKQTGQGPQAETVEATAAEAKNTPEAATVKETPVAEDTGSATNDDAVEPAEITTPGAEESEVDEQVKDPAGDTPAKKTEQPVPDAVKEKQAREDGVRTPPKSNRPPMNPFMREAAERKAKATTRKGPTAEEMAEKVTAMGINIKDNFMFKALTSHLNEYVEVMAPNTPISDFQGAMMQKQLASDIFASLESRPQESLAALRVIELYFKEYRGQALGRRYVFRFMDSLKLDHQKALAFQSLLHLFVELGNAGDRTRKEIAREVSIRKIADYMPGNTDAQIRLAEFMS